MGMSGTLEEVLAKLFDLYLENRIDDKNTEYFLFRLHHPNGERVFAAEDIVKMLDMLQKAKIAYEEEV